MKSEKQVTVYQNQKKVWQTLQEEEHFTNRAVNIVVLTLTFIAYLPLLLDPNFYQAPTWKIAALLGLGILYAFFGTRGMMWTETQAKQRPWIFPFYFVVQILIIALILYLSQGFQNNFWLLILPVSAQSLALPLVGTIIVCASMLFIVYFLFLADQSGQEAALTLLGIGTGMLFTILFTYIALRETAARYQIQTLAKNLHEANLRLSEYAAQAEELATTKERNRLAREIHDNLGHYLTVINVQIEAGRTIMSQDPEKAQAALATAQKMTQDGLNAIRHSINALRESPLENQSLSAAILKLIQETNQAGIRAHLTVAGDEKELGPKTSLTLFRIAQEGLTNVRKHAQASRVDLLLDFEDPECVKLGISDNGIGLVENGNKGFGLIGIQERVYLLDGELTIETAPGRGYSLAVIIPLGSSPGHTGQDNGR